MPPKDNNNNRGGLGRGLGNLGKQRAAPRATPVAPWAPRANAPAPSPVPVPAPSPVPAPTPSPVPAPPAASASTSGLSDVTKGIQSLTAGASRAAALSQSASVTGKAALGIDVETIEEEDDEEQEAPEVPEATATDKEDDPDGKEQELPFISQEHIEKLGPHQRIVAELPADAQLPVTDADLYPEELAGIYNKYRGRDRPALDEMAIPDAKGEVHANKGARIDWTGHYVQVCCRGLIKGKDFTASEIKNPGKKVARDMRVVKMTYIMHSQVPGFHLTVTKRVGEDGEKKPNVHFKYFANMLKKNLELNEYDIENDIPTVSIALAMGQDPALVNAFTEVGDIKTSDGLMETYIKLPSNGALRKGFEPKFGAPSRRALITGITSAELKDLVALADQRNVTWGDDTLCPADWAIVSLMRASEMSIYRYWPDTQVSRQIFDTFDHFWTAAMRDAGLHGNFPYYRRVAARQEREISDRMFKITGTLCPPPRHLVYKWRESRQDGRLVAVVPEQWRGFPQMAHYPDAESKAFAMRLAIERGRNFGRAAIQEALDQKATSLVGTFRAFPAVEDLYWVDIVVDGGAANSIFGENRKTRPATHTRLKLTINGDDRFGGRSFKGTVQDDILGTKPSISACVRQKRGETSVTQGAEFANFRVTVELDSDGTACDRQNAAMCELGRGVERTRGIDLVKLVLRADPTIDDPNEVHAEAAQYAGVAKAYWDIIERADLNEKQVEAARVAFEEAFLLLHGPPGTGKTRTLLAIALGHIHAGRRHGKNRQIVACAPSNSAVDHMLDALIGACGGMSAFLASGLKVCRFKAGFVQRNVRKTPEAPLAQAVSEERAAGDEHTGETEGLESRIWDLCERMADAGPACNAQWEFYFHNQRMAYIRRVSKTKGHAYQPEAMYYLKTRLDMKKAADGDEKKRLKADLRENESLWDARYLQEEVDIVFCTNSAAGHETLIEHFRPSILISDEAALASLPDVATPMAAFKEHIKTVILAGDHKQQGPSAMSRGANETLKDIISSLFIELQNDPETPGKVQLEVQHRMKPAISRMVSQIWYDGTLADHWSVQQQTELDVSIAEAWAPADQRGWNYKSPRLAVDVSGSDVAEVLVPNSSSLANPAEAKAVVDYVQYLLAFTPREPKQGAPLAVYGRKIVESDILIVTPYAGQVSEILLRLAEAQTGVKVEVVTTAAVQGRESPIVLLSLVRNVAGKPFQTGFIKESTLLCVNFSRARNHQVTFGNFAAWGSGWMRGQKAMTQVTGRMGALAQVVQDHVREKSIISQNTFAALLAGRQPVVADDLSARLHPPSVFQTIAPGFGTSRGVRAPAAPRARIEPVRPTIPRPAQFLQGTNAFRDFAFERKSGAPLSPITGEKRPAEEDGLNSQKAAKTASSKDEGGDEAMGDGQDVDESEVAQEDNGGPASLLERPDA